MPFLTVKTWCGLLCKGKLKNYCHKGKIKLKEVNSYSNYLKNLVFNLKSSESKNFKERIGYKFIFCHSMRVKL